MERMDLNSVPAAKIIIALGKRVKEYRIARQLTQKEVSDRTGISITTLRNFENGHCYNLTMKKFIEIIQVVAFADGLRDLLPEIPPSPEVELRLIKNRKKRVRHGKEHTEG